MKELKFSNITTSIVRNTSLEVPTLEAKNESLVLCSHCGRTLENKIKCIGRCVADNEY